ncbi:hypothetical protein Tco_0059926 [Tanacetum coccineum]
MADNRTMAQMLQAPIEGYEDAIVVLPINANNFELKQPLINLVQSNKFTVDASIVHFYMSGHILHVHPAQSQTSSVLDQQYQLYLAMKADPQLQQQDIAICAKRPQKELEYEVMCLKEKRVMRHSEIHKFCDATLNRVLEGLKSYNNDVKYGYVQKDLTKEEAEYLKLFEEEIEERLKHCR